MLLLLLLLTLPAVVQAQFTYETNNGTITITGYTGAGGAVTIPDTINGLPVTSIGYGAFSGCSSLISVTIPSSVTNIGADAFNSCSSLTNVTIPNSVTSIGDRAFCATGLSTVTIPNSVTDIGPFTFAYSALTSVMIGNSVTNIEIDAFWDCSRLTNVMVDTNNAVFSIVGGVLFNKSQTTLIFYPEGKAGAYTIPNSVTDIGNQAFYYRTSLTSVTIGTNVTSIGDYAFAGTSLTSVTIPNSVTSIGDYAFAGTSLTSVTIPNSVTNIGDYAFWYCSGLTSVTIGTNVTSIGAWALAGTSLTSVTIPDSVISMGDSAFSGCNLTAIMVDTRNSVYSDVDGVLFDQSQTTLVEYPGGLGGSYTIPNSVTNIGDYAFWYCSGLTSVTIGTNVTSIGAWALARTSLTSVTIPNRVTNIGDDAFYGCANLTSVYFQGNTPSLGANVFVDYFRGGVDHRYWPVMDPATIYYLPATTGWDDVSTNTGLPVVLWTPEVQTSDASFGVRTNQFGFTINWASGMTVVIEACTNLANPTWSPLAAC